MVLYYFSCGRNVAIFQNTRCFKFLGFNYPFFSTYRVLKCNSKVPIKAVYKEIKDYHLPKPTKVDQETIEHLERLALVDFANETGIRRLEDAIHFADQLLTVDTSAVSPLISTMSCRNTFLRTDVVTEGNNRKELLKLAEKTEEYYYVAPPGNIPLSHKKDYRKEQSNEKYSKKIEL